MINVMITFLILLALGVGIVLLQIFLSRKENKWLGLILPIIAFCISLVAVMNIAAFSTIRTTQVTTENGVVVQEETASVTEPIQDTSTLIFSIVSVFLLQNIPTIILLAIYFACREKQRRRKALDRMQAQDLE